MRTLEHDWFDRPVPDNVRLGSRSWLYSSYAFRHFHSRRQPAVTIGSDTGLYDGTYFELGPTGEVEIGDYCTLVGAIICTNHRILIEDFVLISHEVVLADTPFMRPFDEAVEDLHGDSQRAPVIHIGRNAWIGLRATLLAGAHIGEGAIVGAGAVIDFPVPPRCVAVGNPGRIVRRPSL